MLRLFQRRRVPKKFLLPRPMSGAPKRANAAWRHRLVEALAAALPVLLVLLQPLRHLDDGFRERILRGAAESTLSQVVLLSEVPAAVARSPSCPTQVARALSATGARAGLVLSPLPLFCEGILDASSDESELAPPIAQLPTEVLRLSEERHVVGIAPAVADDPLLTALGLRPQHWVAPRPASAIPKVLLHRLQEGMQGGARAAAAGGSGDVIVLLSLQGATTAEGLPPTEVAGAISAALEDPGRRQAPTWLVACIALLIAVITLLVQRRGEPQAGLRGALAVSAGSLLALALADWLARGLLAPVPTLTVGVALCIAVSSLPRRFAQARVDSDAERVLKDAGRLVPMAAADVDAAFWQRLARTAAQNHAADDVLVAELPPFSWRLKFWPNGETDDSIIRERRRDIRRTPYADNQGAPVASVVTDYLVMKGTPAVLLPLMAHGEVEGYLMLVGQKASDEFTTRPKRAERLARELGQLIRARRLARLEEQGWRRRRSVNHSTNAPDAGVLDHARAAMTEVRLLSALVQEAPVGLFYVDSFGDVRLLGRSVAARLPEYGIDLPAQGLDGSLEVGALPLKRLLGGLTKKMRVTPPAFTEIGDEGYRLEIPTGAQGGDRVKSLDLHIVPLRSTAPGVAGLVGTLVESAVRTASLAPRPSIMVQTVAALQVFSLARLLAVVVEDAAQRCDGKVRLQPPRDEAHVVAHRAELESSLVAFLAEAGRAAGKTEGPVVTVAVHGQRVQLTILDLRLGTPAAALERTLAAPDNPPKGLETLASLARAVEDSHGELRLRAGPEWGSTLEADLVRARPRAVEPRDETARLRLYNPPAKIQP